MNTYCCDKLTDWSTCRASHACALVQIALEGYEGQDDDEDWCEHEIGTIVARSYMPPACITAVLSRNV